ncbi:LLM class flavin-dependent oxidoreductase [Conexibacter sp. W3-3-2]|uniref:LLM class flavin-dependent oxidoreductase n=1 Tax=Conexibacter sp. W3-3-2 TaxID=2675227 RepID=UPI0012B82B0B|nr:LLM class flavin-dependent oxidoreductase [Conexibacter sp. W3-3-2]MTD43939.1 LLM class flavin-dependent oxidoreductase [Conexibacter sp. W3-3-2]
MRFGLLHEHPLPRPWTPGDEGRLLREGLDRIALADRLGLHRVWVAEHHFQEERSHGAGALAVLGAAAQRTARLRLGWGPVTLASSIRHPAVLAAGLATLEALGDGRVDLAATPATVGAEVGGFGVDRATATPDWVEQLRTTARLLAPEPFTGADGRHVRMPPRALVPAGSRSPHPGLWMACARPEDVRVAGELGLGVLAQWLPEPEEAAEWVAEHRAVLRSERCVPAGAAITAGFAVVLPAHVHADERTAIDRGIDGAHFHAYAREHYETFGDHRPGSTDVWDAFSRHREDVGFARSIVVADGAPLPVKLLRDGRASLRGAVGTPGQVVELARRYADAGVDELVLVLDGGRTAHEHAVASLELLAAEVLPAFAADPAPADGLTAAERDAALARRRPAPPLDPGYAFGPMDDGPVAEGPGGDAGPAAPGAAGDAAGSGAAAAGRGAAGVQVLRAIAQARGAQAFRTFVRRSDDRRLERTIGSARGLAAVFATMAARFEPDAAAGFTGDLRYELRGADGVVRTWTVSCRLDGATAHRDARPDPAVTIKLGLADFVRLAAGELDPGKALLTGRLDLEGDFAVATRLGEMFGEV